MIDTKRLTVLKLKSGKSISQIATDAGISRVRIYQLMTEEGTAPMKMAQKLEKATGISHQYFLYPAPICYQFVGAL